MTEEQPTVRLNQFLREAKVTLERVNSFLKERKLITTDLTMNSKIDQKIYNVLLKQFASEIATQKELEKYSKPHEKKEILHTDKDKKEYSERVISQPKETTTIIEKVEVEEKIEVKAAEVTTDIKEQVEKSVEIIELKETQPAQAQGIEKLEKNELEQKPTIEIFKDENVQIIKSGEHQVKVLGEIDIEAYTRKEDKKKEKRQQDKPDKITGKGAEKSSEKKPEDKEIKTSSDEAQQTIKEKEETIKEQTPSNQETKDISIKEEIPIQPIQEVNVEAKEPVDIKTESEQSIDEKGKTHEDEKDLPHISIPVERLTGPTILGEIDLEKIERKPKPTEKKEPIKPSQVEENKESIREEKKQPQQPKISLEDKDDVKKGDFKQDKRPYKDTEIERKHREEKLSGKNDDKPRRPVATSRPDQAPDITRKKRRRIFKDRGEQPQSTEHRFNIERGRFHRDKFDVNKDKQKPVPISDEEIQRQIKETLSRLTNKEKTTKAAKYRRQKREQIQKSQLAEQQELEKQKNILKVTEFLTVSDLATMMNVPVNEVISTCLSLGLFVSINQRLDAEEITLVADEFGYDVEFVTVEDEILEEEEVDNPEDLVPRHPVVTVMGHVDHGKTSLLDYIRHTNVIAGEAGGITQHIGAYEVTLEDGRKITFLDTPGHEAFTAMRARGAKITDIAIIVIAADDRVMPQTVEAINHARAANVPMVFAINKIDKPNANPEKIKEELSKMNILVEDWGGKYQCQEISAKHGTNVKELLEKVLLEAEFLNLRANPNRRAVGSVIESSLEKGRGYVAKVLVQNGTLRIGDIVVAGCHFGRVKAMFNERNQLVKSAGPSTPVLLVGLDGAPQAGDKFVVYESEKEAKQICAKRQQLLREQGLRTQKHITLDEIGRRIAIGNFKELNIIVKADVDGSVEALADSLLKLSNPKVQVNIIHKSVGQITESDVLLASASDAIIVGFQVRPSLSARKLAETEQIDIRTYSVIYDAIEEVKAAIEGMLAPTYEEKVVCNLEVRETFKISKVGTVAGCMVLDGKITRNTKIRVIRDGIVIHTGNISSLKRFKDDVKEVVSGYECGLSIENFNDIKVGDIIEGFEVVEVKPKL